MFNWIGGLFASGIVKKLGSSPELVGKGLEAIWNGIQKVPGLNIPPLLMRVLGEAEEYWDNMPQEKKQEFFEALVSAATKAMASYAKD